MLFGSSATSATKIRKTPSSRKRNRFLQSSIQLTSTRRWVQYGMCIAALVWISTGLLVWKPSGITQIPLKQGNDSKKQSIAFPEASNHQNGVRGIVYVHVGKTGGEWIKAQLKMVCKTRRNKNIRAVCLQQKYPTYLSKLTVGYIHTSTMYIDSDVQKPRQTIPRTKSIRDASGAFSHYLFSLRHPLRRLMSWYTYNHPKSCDEREPHSPSCKTSTWKTSFYKCFPTLQDLANHIQPVARMNMQSDDCAETFWNGWHARGDNMEPKDSNHLRWNYQYYWNETMVQTPNKKLLVVRLESIEKDLLSLEVYLGKDPMAASKIFWHPPDSFHFVRGGASSQLDKAGTRNLCCVLFEEMTLYREVLQQASNPLERKEQSLEQINGMCHFSSWEEMKSECGPK